MVVFITLTNTGYINYTLNCLKSLEAIQSTVPLHCYCIGKTGIDLLNEKGYECTLIDEEENSNFQTFRQGNWSNITYNKFKIIHENLLKHDYVCFTDGDIVYENANWLNFLLKNIGENDMLIQNDALSDQDNTNLCSGFMFIKSTPNTLALFNPAMMAMNKSQKGWDDQVYINSIKSKLVYRRLPLNLFPNGKYYYHNSNIQPYLIHFNWVVGHEKQKKMIHYKKWLI